MLMSDASFSGTVLNHGGKGLVTVLRKEAGKLGYGGNAARSDVFRRVNAKGMAKANLHVAICFTYSIIKHLHNLYYNQTPL
jgi:hypothetical protein